jgi:hypothetical protein
MNATSPWRALCLTACLAVCCATPARAAGPRDELLRLVPDDVALCMIVQDLRDYSLGLSQSPLADTFRKSWVGQAVRLSPEMTRLAQMEKEFKEATGIDWPQLRDEIVGDCVVLAYRPGPPGKPQEEQGLLLVRARNAQLLAALIERLNTAQKKAGDLEKLEEREYQGIKYFRRAEKKQAPYFYWLHGPVLAVSPQEAMLQRAIDRDKNTALPDKEAPVLARRLRQLGLDRTLLTLWLNPRAFDPELEARAGQANPAEGAFLKTFLSNWKALDDVALFARPEEQLEYGLAVRARPQSLTPGLRKVLAEAAKPSELWKAFPDDALLAVAGRIDAPALIETIVEFLPEESRKSFRDALAKGNVPFGRVVKDVLPNLGPDAGLCITAPKADDKTWLPRAVWALRVRPGDGDVPAEQTLLDTLNFFANLAVLDYNNKHPDRLTLKSATQDKVEIKYFVNEKRFPPGFQPAYAVKDGYLLLADAPETIRSFKMAGNAAPADEVPLLRASLVTLRGYLKERQEALVGYLAEKNQIPREEAARRLVSLEMGLQFFDRLELTQRSTGELFTLTLRIKTSQPLRK